MKEFNELDKQKPAVIELGLTRMYLNLLDAIYVS